MDHKEDEDPKYEETYQAIEKANADPKATMTIEQIVRADGYEF